ncbi:MAG: hypothetical protein JSV22_08415 [Bacteroidales bacterium]|nr:MAG: hypothetical protein JSV22_08415 [Bacteroidales bacterium]
MKIKAIITGSTGMLGKGVLLECLDSSHVESVLVINRRPVGLKHEKLKEIIHADFYDLSTIKDQLAGYNTCYFCLGVSAAGMSEKDYSRITYDLTLNFAQTLLSLNPELAFCYISGAGTDSSEKGRMMWARVKGKTENALLALPFKKTYMLRPAYIQPMKGIRSSTRIYNILYTILKPLYPLLKAFPKIVTNTEKLGKAMIKLVLIDYDKNILENIDLNRLVT